MRVREFGLADVKDGGRTERLFSYSPVPRFIATHVSPTMMLLPLIFATSITHHHSEAAILGRTAPPSPIGPLRPHQLALYPAGPGECWYTVQYSDTFFFSCDDHGSWVEGTMGKLRNGQAMDGRMEQGDVRGFWSRGGRIVAWGWSWIGRIRTVG